MKARSVRIWRKGNDIVPHKRCLSLLYVSVAILLCALLLISCTKQPAKTGAGIQGEVTVPPSRVVSPAPPTALSPTPNITLKVINCPSSLSSLNWDKLVGTKSNVNKVQQVMCGSLESYGSLAALINVRYYSADSKLDFYIYANLFGTPTRTFSMQGLLDGDAQISSVGSIITAEVGPGDAIKGNPDVFKEYRWNGTAFVQVVFPGLYPDMTRYQAERDQATVAVQLAAGKKSDSWKFSGQGEVKRLAQYIFHWSNFSLQVVTNNKRQNLTIIAATNLGPGGGGFLATLHHLNGDLNNIYEITQISPADGNITLTSPSAYEQLTTPIKVNGTTLASSSILGQVVVYDDMYTTIGDTGTIRGSTSQGYVRFTHSISYHLNAQQVQEGVVAFYPTNQNSFALSNQALLVKVLLTA